MSVEHTQPHDSSRRPELVVVVDDEELILSSLKRSLAPSFEVATYQVAEQALNRVRDGGVSAVLSDIAMPGMNGLELLAAVHEHDPDLPVVLMTGAPTLESATSAIEQGVYRYLPKPVQESTVVSLLEQATQLHRLAKLKREALELRESLLPEPSPHSLRFRDVLDSLWMAFQPIVSLRDQKVFGYEALLRSSHPAFLSPAQLLDSAERLQALHELGRIVRRRAAAGLNQAGHGPLLFVNLHPRDLADPDLLDASSPLTACASRIVLEITERASLGEMAQVQGQVAALRKLGFRIAIDDLGAGYAGLTSFALLEPEIVKLDMSLTRGIDSSPVKRKLVSSLVGLCREMNIVFVVEGVETPAERDTLAAMGCDLMQGHLFARPGRALPRPKF